MVEQILPNLYTIEVPLPGSPLKATNSYIIKADGRSLIIDTGMNREECLTVLSAGLKELDVDLTKGKINVEEPSEIWYRSYLGGMGAVAYHLLREVPSKVRSASASHQPWMRSSVSSPIAAPSGRPASGRWQRYSGDARLAVVSWARGSGRRGEAEEC